MKHILEHLVKAIVDNPDKVVIDEFSDNGIMHLTISVDASDMGKVIGKEGKVIRSIRNVMKIPAIKRHERIEISIQEQEATQ